MRDETPVRAWDARRVGLFAFEIGRMWGRQNPWRRQWRNLGDADDT